MAVKDLPRVFDIPMMQANDEEIKEAKQHCLDIRTPYNKSLSALYKRSFAYHTVKERIPRIITQTIDTLCRSLAKITLERGDEAGKELREIISKMSKFKYEIQTNKTFEPISRLDISAQFYNDLLNEEISKNGGCTYFTAVWLHTECYVYRRLREFFQLSKVLNTYDPFLTAKQDSAYGALGATLRLAEALFNTIRTMDTVNKKAEFINLLKLSLWGNKCDLSLSNGEVVKMDELSNSELTEMLDSFILSDHSRTVWNLASEVSVKNTIDIVLDNAGYELFTDLCLADFLITAKLVERVRFHCKDMPWFVSDVTVPDFHWTINQMLASSTYERLEFFSNRWAEYLNSDVWILETHYFWTLPVEFTQMRKVAPDLYSQLTDSKIVIFKGDLNYRKLYGEINWEYTTPTEKALQGFHPAPVCSLRTIKADLVCGLEKGVAEKADETDPNWKTNGNFGLIQCCDRTVVINN